MSGTKKLMDYRREDLKAISSVFISEAKTLFKKKSLITAKDRGKWEELIYCILAGSQFPVIKLKVIHKQLIKDYYKETRMNSFLKSGDKNAMELAKILKALGYRYHTQKAFVISNAAKFFLNNYKGRISLFLKSEQDSSQLRDVLVQNIKGIGFKIASHWLRNIGYEVCTIDIHLRRLFVRLKLSKDNPEAQLSTGDFLMLEEILREWSKLQKVGIGILQYAVWEYARNYEIKLYSGNKISSRPKKNNVATVEPQQI